MEMSTIRKIGIAGVLVALGVIGRLLLQDMLPQTPHLYMTINGITQPVFMMDLFFVVATVSLFAGVLLGRHYALLVPMAVMIITDVALGNTTIFMFTWSGFVFIALLGGYARRARARRSPTTFSALHMAGLSVGSVLIYDVWTNFGCWLGWYPHTVGGLATCFTVALPFTLWHLLSTVAAVTAVTVPLALALRNVTPIIRTSHRYPSLLHRYSPVAAAVCLAVFSVASL